MDIPRNWRLRNQRYLLEGSRCMNCGHVYFPPRELCKNCRSDAHIQPHRLHGEGHLLSYTIVYQAPEGFDDQIPYAVGLIELTDGPRLTAMLSDTNLDELEIGMPVEMIIRKINQEGQSGLINYGYKFRPKFP